MFSPTYRDANGKSPFASSRELEEAQNTTVSFPKHLPRDSLFHQNKAQGSQEQRENFERHPVPGWFLSSRAEGSPDVQLL